jgi:hypothetical protein
VTPENVAGLIAAEIAKAFPSAQFGALFENKEFARGWTASDALATWYSFGDLALVVSALSLFNDEAKLLRILNDCRQGLLKYWNVSQDVSAKFQATVQAGGEDAARSFMNCKGGGDLHVFFNCCANRILGAPVPFSVRSTFEAEMRGIMLEGDPFLAAALCGLFIEACAATKKLMEKFPID